jgi:hypothetical protein
MTAMVVGSLLTVWWVRWRTGSVGLDSAVWTPDLRWRDEDGPEEVSETEREESAEADGAEPAQSVTSDEQAAPTPEAADGEESKDG